MKDFSRSDRLSSQLSRELSEILRAHPRLPHGLIISVMGVELTKDLRSGKVYYSAFGPDEAKEKAEEFINDNKKRIRKELAAKVRVRYVPELTYLYDSSMERGQRINELLERIKSDDEEQQ